MAVRQVRAGWFEWIAVPAYVFSILLLMITLFVGKGSGTAMGVRSFLDLGFLQFQPAELAKLATVLALARLGETLCQWMASHLRSNGGYRDRAEPLAREAVRHERSRRARCRGESKGK